MRKESRGLTAQPANQLGDSPDDEGEAVEEEQVADHEQGIGDGLHGAQKRKLGGVVGGDVEHTEVVAGLAGGGIQVEMVHQNIAHDGKGDEAEEHDGGGVHLLQALAVAAGDNEVHAHDHQDSMPEHGVEGHGDEVGVQHRRGLHHDRQTAYDAVESQKTVADLASLVPRHDRRGDGHVDGHRAELEGEELKAVVIVEGEPEELLEDLTANEDHREDRDRDAVGLTAVLTGYGQSHHHTGDEHDPQPQEMKPAEHTRAHVAVVDVAPGPVDHFIHENTWYN